MVQSDIRVTLSKSVVAFCPKGRQLQNWIENALALNYFTFSTSCAALVYIHASMYRHCLCKSPLLFHVSKYDSIAFLKKKLINKEDKFKGFSMRIFDFFLFLGPNLDRWSVIKNFYAEWERGFSAMNAIFSKDRYSPLPETITARYWYIYVHCRCTSGASQSREPCRQAMAPL